MRFVFHTYILFSIIKLGQYTMRGICNSELLIALSNDLPSAVLRKVEP